MAKKDIVLSQGKGLLSSLRVPIDEVSDFSLSDKAKDFLGRILLNMKAGLVTVDPLICRGPDNCPFISKCPIFKAHGRDTQYYSISNQCILEASYVRDRFIEYIQEFQFKEEEVENSPTLRSLLNKLVEFDIYDFRLSVILSGANNSYDATLLIEQNIALAEDTDEDGNPIAVTQTQEHPAWKIKERIHRQRMEVLDALISTPRRKKQIQASLKERTQTNEMQQVRNLQQKVDDLLELLDK